MDVAPADLNKDGVLDLIGAGWGSSGAVRVWLGDGTGKWISTSPINKGSYNGVSVGDVNADGNLDILAAAYKNGVHIFLGDGKGDFNRIQGPIQFIKARSKTHPGTGEYNSNLTGDESFWKALAVDLDGDNMLDIVASSLDSRGIMAWQNRGKGKWRIYKGQFPLSGIYYGMALADLNADGYPDISAANYGEGIQIWPGNTGPAIKARQMEIEQLPTADRLAVLAAPMENNVFTTVNGVEEYKIGTGDVLEITYWEAGTSKKEEILVRPDGKISFGFVDDLQVNGLTASQLDNLLTSKFKSYVRKPRIDVVVKEYNSKSVTLLGAISIKSVSGSGPGKYRLSGKTTLIELLTRAGGPTQNAKLDSVNIRRKNGQTITLDLFKAIHRGDPGKDFVLDDGDVVFVSSLEKDGNRVYVFGEVENPGTYTFTSREVRLVDAISEAGGTTVFAAAAETRVVRGDITKPKILISNLQHLIEDGDQSQNFTLASGDLVYVPRSGFGSVNVFAKRIRSLLELLIWPARLVNDWDRGYDVVFGND
jgi:polysaccharide export outer membrane protein